MLAPPFFVPDKETVASATLALWESTCFSAAECFGKAVLADMSVPSGNSLLLGTL
jgi:hypothetical protein